MSTALDLTDPLVRAMADRHHQPTEVWNVGGSLVSVHCEQCGHSWPCETRQALDDIAAEDAVRPFPLSAHAVSRLEAEDAPRFTADPARTFP
jgi:hypothetical protein